ncbi:MAG: NAD-dependent epimerase/dehydratase family protein [Steroidobacteraceae bacterium]
MSKRYYLTGSTGFVGRHVLARLTGDGNYVVAAVRQRTAAVMPPGVGTSIFDLERPEVLATADLDDVDTVVHAAARVHVANTTGDEIRKLWRCNVVATDALARAAVTAGVRRFIYVSSIKVNGERTTDRPFTSFDEPAPGDHYARSKLAAEEALKTLESGNGMEVVIVRPPLVYGPGVGANFRRLLTLVYRGVPLPLAAIDNRRSLLSVWNFADFIATIASHTGATRGTWLVSDGEDLSTADLVRLIAAAMGHRPRLFPVPLPLLRVAGRLLGREAEVSRLCDSLQVDAAPARKAFGWAPPIAVDEAVKKTVSLFVAGSCAHV